MTEPTRGYSSLRRNRWSQPGGVYLLTTVTLGRQPFFSGWSAASEACRTFRAAFEDSQATQLCWVLMPDHWHALVRLDGSVDLPSLMKRAKGRVARAVNLCTGRSGPLWMPGYHDCALRSEERTVDFARYIVANPIRARIVRRLGDYPFWDAVWLRESGRG